MLVAAQASATGSPNTPMQVTPLRVPEIGAFLNTGIDLSVFPIYRRRRN